MKTFPNFTFGSAFLEGNSKLDILQANLLIVVDVAAKPGAVFTTTHFLRNLQMGPISLRVTLYMARKACQEQTL
jgi:hypothetical protein